MLLWSLIPFINTICFFMVDLPPFSEEGQRQTLRELVHIPEYLVAVVALGFAGASEVTLAQWTSAFVEEGLGCQKIVADLLGFGLFGVGMIIGRLWFGFKGETVNLYRLMIPGALLSAAMGLILSVSSSPVLSLVTCALAGLFVCLLWPGIVTLSAARFPLAGASMFAFLAASGDSGAGLMPWGLGVIADRVTHVPAWLVPIYGEEMTPEQLGLRVGLLATTLCPLVMTLLLVWMYNRDKHRKMA
jgi:fucose permease